MDLLGLLFLCDEFKTGDYLDGKENKFFIDKSKAFGTIYVIKLR